MPRTIDHAPIRIAVLGAGHLGRIHAKLLAQNPAVELVAVVDPMESARNLVGDQLRVPTLASFRDLEGRVDAAVIASPTFLHFELGHWCLLRGIHTLIEKPICNQAEDAQVLVELARANKCVLQVGHVERFNSVWGSLPDQLDGESVQYIQSRREGTYTGRSTDIGIVMDLMIHDLDLILSYIPSDVVEIQAYGRHVLGSHEDFAVAQLGFRNGCMAHLTASRLSPIARRQMELHSQNTVVELDFATGVLQVTETCADVAAGDRQADSMPPEARGRVKDELFSNWLERSEHKAPSVNAIENEHLDFVRCIVHGSIPVVAGPDGYRALQIAMAIVDQIAVSNREPDIIPAATRFDRFKRKAS